MSSNKIRGGKAEVEVSIRDRVGKGLKAIEQRLTKFGAGVAKLGAAITAAGAAGVTALSAITQRFASIGDDIHKMGIRTQASAEFLSEMAFAANQSGTSIDGLGSALFRMNRRVANAMTGTGPAVRALEEMGLSAERLGNLDTEQRFLTIADALKSVENPSRRAQLGFEILGDNFKQLQPLLEEGSDGINALRQEARDLGATMSTEDANAAAAFTDALGRVTFAMRGLTIQIGAALAPVLEHVATAFSRVVSQIVGFIRDNRELVQTIFAISVAAVAVGTVITGVGLGIITLGALIGSMTAIASAAFATLGAIIGAITSPITLVVAGIAAIGYAALEATSGLEVLGQMFGELGSTATTAWQGIVAAISNGDLETAGEIAFTALEVAWLTVTTRLREVWRDVVQFLKDVWLRMVRSIVEIGAEIYFGVSKYWDLLSNALIAAFDVAFVYIRGALDTIITAIAKAIISAKEFFGLFSADQADQVRGSLDAELQRRSEGRQAGLDRRADERGQGLADRDADRRRTADAFSRAVGDVLRSEPVQIDSSELTAAQQRLAAKQAELAERSAKAQEELKNSQEQAEEDARRDPQGILSQLSELATGMGQQAKGAQAVGTSSAAAVMAGALGFDSRPMEDTAQSTKQMVGLLRRIERQKGGLQA
jgi:TP901 family phage tail tape measure protein